MRSKNITIRDIGQKGMSEPNKMFPAPSSRIALVFVALHVTVR